MEFTKEAQWKRACEVVSLLHTLKESSPDSMHLGVEIDDESFNDKTNNECNTFACICGHLGLRNMHGLTVVSDDDHPHPLVIAQDDDLRRALLTDDLEFADELGRIHGLDCELYLYGDPFAFGARGLHPIDNFAPPYATDIDIALHRFRQICADRADEIANERINEPVPA